MEKTPGASISGRMAKAKKTKESGAVRVSAVWQGVVCRQCRYPVAIECHDAETNDWRPSCLNPICSRHRAPRTWQKEPKWATRAQGTD